MKVELPLYQASVMFARTVLYASDDDRRPVLMAVKVEARADGTVVASAADGFRLGIQTTRGKVSKPGEVLIHARHIREALRDWPKPLRGNGTVVIEATSKTVRLTYNKATEDDSYLPAVTVSAPPVPGTYPDVPHLVEEAFKAAETPGDRIAFNADYLSEIARVAKLDPASTGIVRVEIGRPSEPGTFIFTNPDVGEFVVLIMPMFVQWDDERAIDRIFTALGIRKAQPRRRKKSAA